MQWLNTIVTIDSDLLQQLFLSDAKNAGVSKFRRVLQLSMQLCRRLDPLINAWKNRSLKDNQYPFLIVDALIIRIREEQRVVS